jgi:predicted DNA binding CopG/RHH family protein
VANMRQKVKIPSSDEAWDEGSLGRDDEFVRKAEDKIEDKIDEAVELQLISIRLQKSLIEDFKMIAKMNGLGYQTLMRQILKRFADCEKKQILREFISEAAKTAKAEKAAKDEKALEKEQSQPAKSRKFA